MATAVEFDFASRQERPIPAEEAAGACASGKFCWIDADSSADPEGSLGVLRALDVNNHAIEAALGHELDGRHDVHDDCVHFAVTAASFGEGLETSHVDAVLGRSYLVTLRGGQVRFLDEVRRTYRPDFL